MKTLGFYIVCSYLFTCSTEFCTGARLFWSQVYFRLHRKLCERNADAVVLLWKKWGKPRQIQCRMWMAFCLDQLWGEQTQVDRERQVETVYRRLFWDAEACSLLMGVWYYKCQYLSLQGYVVLLLTTTLVFKWAVATNAACLTAPNPH